MAMTDTVTREELDTHVDEVVQAAVPYVLIVWNDPVNLMTYVSYVFQSYFGYSKSKAKKLMLEVHRDGKSVVATGSKEKIEADTFAMHEFGLWATFQKADEA
nr:ATP-dependent Clp protease adapter ClpS [Neomicrococcus lactis]